MKHGTCDLLAALERIEWFSAVGHTVRDFDVATVGSWSEAMAACQSEKWDFVTMEAKNLFTTVLATERMEEYRKWNNLVEEVKAVHEPLIACKTSPVIAAYQLPKAFLDCVKWDLLMACMEQEYSEFVAPGFFTRLAQLYIAGHFPCGWKGPFPGQGPLLVY